MSQASTPSLTPKIFINKVLAGTATGIIVGLIPNALPMNLPSFENTEASEPFLSLPSILATSLA